MLTWSDMRWRISAAWRILMRGDSLVGPACDPLPKLELSWGDKRSAASWASRAKTWHRQHSKTAGSASVEAGRALAEEALAMSPAWREERSRGDDWGFWSERYASNLFAMAIDSLDGSSEVAAKEACELHALWIRSGAGVLSALEIERSARAVERSSWWEAASAWDAKIKAEAKSQALAGQLAIDDEAAYSWLQSASWCFDSIVERCARQKLAPSARDIAAWTAYCDLPWPERKLSPDIKRWISRKLGAAIMPIDASEIDNVMAAMGESPAWRDVVRAFVARPGDARRSEVCQELWSIQERSALAESGGPLAASRGALRI